MVERCGGKETQNELELNLTKVNLAHDLESCKSLKFNQILNAGGRVEVENIISKYRSINVKNASMKFQGLFVQIEG